MNRNTTAIIVSVAIVVALAVAVVYLRGDEDGWVCSNGAWSRHGSPDEPMPLTGCGQELVRYSDPRYGFTLAYPKTYRVEAREETVPVKEKSFYQVTLMDDEAVRQALSAGPTEYPPGIIVAVFGEDALGTTPAEWVRNNPVSNFDLPDTSEITETDFKGYPAAKYTTIGGLYNARHIVFFKGSDVYMLTGQYIDQSDPITGYFDIVASSLEV